MDRTLTLIAGSLAVGTSTAYVLYRRWTDTTDTDVGSDATARAE